MHKAVLFGGQVEVRRHVGRVSIHRSHVQVCELWQVRVVEELGTCSVVACSVARTVNTCELWLTVVTREACITQEDSSVADITRAGLVEDTFGAVGVDVVVVDRDVDRIKRAGPVQAISDTLPRSAEC